MLDRLATAIRSRDNRIRITISYGRSTDYVDEYVIEDMNGNTIPPWDFPSKWNGKVFQLVENTEEWGK